MRKSNILFTGAFVFFSAWAVNSFAIEPPAEHSGNSNNKKSSAPVLAAGCSAPSATIELDLNNVRTIIHTGGDMWINRNPQGPGYEIPKRSGKHSIYAGGLWMGGLDVNGQLKLAAQTFRERGNDFWPGPLNMETVEIDEATCREYDKHFPTTRQDIEKFNNWFNLTLENPALVKSDPEYSAYTIPANILNWPAHGNPAKKEDYYLAPFFDRNGDGNYNPYDGDFPGYELVRGQNDCRVSREVNLYGDRNIWWVFNDKGDIHTQSGGAAIGMEVRGQAFAFATNDEVNNMTFYNYEMINRSTFVLRNTYFGVWVDSDLGRYTDDYVGCDVERGLGFCYNGAEIDGSGGPGDYGANPPAVGVDFFEGPYMDNDGFDNPGPADNFNHLTFNAATEGNGIPYRGLGIGFGDGIVDNERFGMARFLYHNSGAQGGNPNTTDPRNASDYYNYMRGIWRDGTPNRYGGTGHQSTTGASAPIAKYMFPGTSDPVGWGVSGLSVPSWTEETENNLPMDRRFCQSAGPFTLEPGAVNNITVGVVWARANTGGPLASVRLMKTADDKAQALFDNCFRILNGPDAPDMTIKELDKELVILLTNRKGSNNFNQAYNEPAFTIPAAVFTDSGDTVSNTAEGRSRNYKFQGYLIYQVRSADVGPDDLGNPDKSRLIFQTDIKDSIVDIINYRYDESLKADIPESIVIRAANSGIQNSFRVTEDRFAVGEKTLVNHKSYYFIAVAYGHNNSKAVNRLGFLVDNPQPYILSRKSLSGGIRAQKGIPHNPMPLRGGARPNAKFGDMPVITRMEGQGNGGLSIELSEESENTLFAGSGKDRIEFPVYKKNRGPVNIKVVDPLSVPDADFEIRLDTTGATLNTASWVITNTSELKVGNNVYSPGTFNVKSDTTIRVRNEQIVFELGMSVMMEQLRLPGSAPNEGHGFLSGQIEFKDSDKVWLTGVRDADGNSPFNWIRSGTYKDPNAKWYDDYEQGGGFKDPREAYEKILGGTWAPYCLTAYADTTGSAPNARFVTFHGPAFNKSTVDFVRLQTLKSVDIVITSDQSKWTRCPVIETQVDTLLSVSTVSGAKPFKNGMRRSPSVGKDGKPDGTGEGMGWFPGYAISVETGERLNMAFGEDSWMFNENGADMIWNPTSNLVAQNEAFDMNNPERTVRFGGKHYIYVFDNTTGTTANPANEMPAYDAGAKLSEFLNGGSLGLRSAWRSCMWVGFPLLVENKKLLETDVRVKLRVERPYARYETSSKLNDGYPRYNFSLKELASTVNNEVLLKDSALAMINVVPNPYYAYSGYEVNQLDNRVKIINLPEQCQISIYTVNGVLIRKFLKADPSSSLDWDLKNQAGIPIAGGIYLIHVNVPNVGERVLKWMGMVRPIDLDSF
jgi:hypothetical protein